MQATLLFCGAIGSVAAGFWAKHYPRLEWFSSPLFLSAFTLLLLSELVRRYRSRLPPASGRVRFTLGVVAIVLIVSLWTYPFWPAPLSIEPVKPALALPGETLKIGVSGYDDHQTEAYNVQFRLQSDAAERPVTLKPSGPEAIEAGVATLILTLPSFTPPDAKEMQASLELTGPWPQTARTTIGLRGKPVLDSVDPSEGFKDTNLEITGKNFDPRPGKTTLFFEVATASQAAKAARETYVVNPQRITGQVPDLPDAGIYQLKARVGEVDTNTLQFSILGPPKITDVQPRYGFAATDRFNGTSIEVRGDNLGTTKERERTTVFIDGRGATIDEVRKYYVRTHVPRDAVTGPVKVVTNAGETIFKTPLGIISKSPQIISFNPDRQSPGGVVDIKVSNFGCSSENANIVFGSIPSLYWVVDCSPAGADLITALRTTVPLSVKGGALQLSVVTPVKKSDPSGPFFVRPKITKVTPGGGLPGTPVTIEGYGLSSDTEVFFGQSLAEVKERALEQTPQTLDAIVPSGVLTAPIRVVNEPSGLGDQLEETFIVFGIDGVIDYKLPPREVEYRNGDVFTFRTDCENDVIRYRQENANGVKEGTFASKGKCPIGLFVDKNSNRLYVANHRSDNIAYFALPTLGYLGSFKTQARPLRVQIVYGRYLDVVNEEGEFRRFDDIQAGDATYWTTHLEGRVLDMFLREDGESVVFLVRGDKSDFIAEGAPGRGFRRHELNGRITNYTRFHNKIYVTNLASDSVSVFDMAGGNIGLIKLDEGSRPFGLAVDQKRGRIYITASGKDRIIVARTADDGIVDSIEGVGIRPKGIAISQSFCVIAVVSGAGDGQGRLWMIDPETRSALPEPFELGPPADELSECQV